MDARVKPGHDAECVARADSPPATSASAHASSPVFFAAPGRPSHLFFFLPSPRSHGERVASKASRVRGGVSPRASPLTRPRSLSLRSGTLSPLRGAREARMHRRPCSLRPRAGRRVSRRLPGLLSSPGKAEGMERREALHLYPRLAACVPLAKGTRPAALHRGVFSASGPRFLTEQSALTLSASSSREVVVPPGGVRRRPGVGGCVHPPPAGATSGSIISTPLDDALDRPDVLTIILVGMLSSPLTVVPGERAKRGRPGTQ